MPHAASELALRAGQHPSEDAWPVTGSALALPRLNVEPKLDDLALSVKITTMRDEDDAHDDTLFEDLVYDPELPATGGISALELAP